MASKVHVEGAAELSRALTELADMKSSDAKSVLKAAVRTPMMKVRKQALANLSSISPGKTPLHRTYLGRLVSAGFAARGLKVVVKLSVKGGTVSAILGVVVEAFYAVSFFELGTSTIPRHPWLVPALEASTDASVRDVGAAMRRRIDQIARKTMQKTSGAAK